MIIRLVKDEPERKYPPDPYKKQVGTRWTLWILFIPIFSITRWI